MGLVHPPSTGRVNMRGLILLLPVLLVLFLAGNVRTEEESSLVGDDLPSNLLPLSEKVELREAREAGKEKDKKNDKKKKEKKTNKLTDLKKKEKKADKKKKNKKDRKTEADRKEKNKKNRKTKADMKKKNKKSQKPKANRKKKNEKNRKTKADRKKKKKKKKTRADRKEKNKKKKTRKDRKKQKEKTKLLNKKKRNKNKGNKSGGRQGPNQGGDWSSCGTTGVNDTCLINAVESLNFEKNQIQNFYKQKARLENQNKVTGNKKGKKGEFNDAAGYMLTAIGGNISTPTCGDNSTRTQRAAADAVATYNTLINCSATIHEACDMPNDTINATFNDNCANIYNLSKTASDDCRSNSAYTNNGSAACNCWEKAAIGIVIAKAEGCTKKSGEQAKAVKKQKKKCIDAFSACKKAEDAAVALIHTCMSGEVNTNASSTET